MQRLLAGGRLSPQSRRRKNASLPLVGAFDQRALGAQRASRHWAQQLSRLFGAHPSQHEPAPDSPPAEAPGRGSPTPEQAPPRTRQVPLESPPAHPDQPSVSPRARFRLTTPDWPDSEPAHDCTQDWEQALAEQLSCPGHSYLM